MDYNIFKDMKTDKKDLENFAGLIGFVLVVLGLWFLWKDSNSYFYFLAFSVVFFFMGLFLPEFLKPVYKIWMGFALLIGWFITRLILSVLFYLVFSPVGLFMKLSGKDPLKLKIDRDRQSYWVKKEKKEFDKKSYEKQY